MVSLGSGVLRPLIGSLRIGATVARLSAHDVIDCSNLACDSFVRTCSRIIQIVLS
jgi:hypothetical protein